MSGRKHETKFFNAGVSGYGTLQSYLYEGFLDNKNKPQLIILQTLVHTDF